MLTLSVWMPDQNTNLAFECWKCTHLKLSKCMLSVHKCQDWHSCTESVHFPKRTLSAHECYTIFVNIIAMRGGEVKYYLCLDLNKFFRKSLVWGPFCSCTFLVLFCKGCIVLGCGNTTFLNRQRAKLEWNQLKHFLWLLDV